ncbi:hypothetical protein GGS20DRAFT_278152 [Poronia punctata]|nr:hypothetical protein GGS20DRAFT_278152 [Poronia punctata]
MAPTNDTFRKIAEDAERNLNTFENKTGANKTSTNDEAGVDTRVENQFPGAEVRYGRDVNTNAGYNKRIPPEEGGDLDARGRETRGQHFQGRGGPEHKLAQQQRDHGGYNEDRYDLMGNSGAGQAQYDASAPQDPPTDLRSGELMAEGKEAARANIQSDKSVPHKSQYRGVDYAAPESTPGYMSAEGYEAPDSVTEASRESARYQ